MKIFTKAFWKKEWREHKSCHISIVFLTVTYLIIILVFGFAIRDAWSDIADEDYELGLALGRSGGGYALQDYDVYYFSCDDGTWAIDYIHEDSDLVPVMPKRVFGAHYDKETDEWISYNRICEFVFKADGEKNFTIIGD